MPTCPKCEELKDVSGFYERSGKPGYLQSWCKECMKELRRQRNPEIAKWQQRKRDARTAEEKEMGKDYQLQYHFDIELHEYKTMLEKQHYACAICGKGHGEDTHNERQGRTKGLSVDHCHRTGQVRGLLCNDCNMALGQFKDDVTILKRAVAYMEGHADLHGRALFDADAALEEMIEKK